MKKSRFTESQIVAVLKEEESGVAVVPRIILRETTPTAFDRPGNPTVNAYDDVPYVGHPYGYTHPDYLATLAILHGLKAAPVLMCRVLEIGCGDGANIVPMAEALPSAEFVGCDYAARPVARAQQMVGELGLSNIRIQQLDLRDIPADAGLFDYIIVHGVYSWIPLEVRQHLMPVIARHLAPNGVAYVSYNVFPGCRVRQAAWDLLRLHTKGCADLKTKLGEARALIALMVDSDGPVNQGEDTLRAEFRRLLDKPDGALCHDDLCDTNHPVYFQEFVADAAGSGLTFLVEAELFTMAAGDFAPHVREALGRMDRLTREQYLDFMRFRPFRNSLICHARSLTEFELLPDRVAGMHASPSQRVRGLVAGGKAINYKNDDARMLMEHLMARWPHNVPVTELAQWFSARETPSGAADVASTPLESLLLELCIAGVVILRTRPVTPAVAAGERPIAFAPARWISRDHDIVPNFYHDAIRLSDSVSRQLVSLLDGTRTRAEIMFALGDACAGSEGGERLDAALAELAQKAMLLA